MTHTCFVETEEGKVIDFDAYLGGTLGFAAHASSFPPPDLRDQDLLPAGRYNEHDLWCLYLLRKERFSGSSHSHARPSRPHLALLLDMRDNFEDVLGLLVLEMALEVMDQEHTDLISVRYE